MPQVTRILRDGQITWSGTSAATLALAAGRLAEPFSEAFERLQTWQREAEGAAADRTEQLILKTMTEDLEARLRRQHGANARALTLETLLREVLDAPGAEHLSGQALTVADVATWVEQLGSDRSTRINQALETYRDAVRVHGERVEQLREALAGHLPGTSADAMDLLPDDQPFAALVDQASNMRQSLDRAAGLIRLEYPNTPIDTTLQLDPLSAYRSDGLSEHAASVRQDVDIRTAEALIVRLLQTSALAPLDHLEALGNLPRRISLRNGEFSVNEQVVARRRSGALAVDDASGPAAWIPDPDGIASALRPLRSSDGWTASSFDRNDFGLDPLPDPEVHGVPSKLKLIVQVGADRDSTVAAWLLARKYAGIAAWVQMEESRDLFQRPHFYKGVGQALLAAATSATEIDILVVGHSGMQLGGHQTLSGWDPYTLAKSLRTGVFDHDEDPALLPRLRRVSLVACDMHAPSMETSFAAEFLKHLVRHPGWTDRAEVTARTGHVHVAEVEVDEGPMRIMKLTGRLDAQERLTLRHQMPGDTKLLRMDPSDGGFTVTDVHPDTDDYDVRQWQRPADELHLMFDSVLRDTVPTPLIRLFTGADGQVDEARMRRVAADPAEVRVLADDLASALASLPESARDAVQAHELLSHSLAGRVVALDGRVDDRDVPATAVLRDERLMDELARQTLDEDTLGLDAISRTTTEGALRALRDSGLVAVDAHGHARLVEQRLQALVAGDDDARLMRAGASLLHLSDAEFEALRVGAGPEGERLLGKAREVRAGFAGQLGSELGSESGSQAEAVAGHGVGLMNTVIATTQLVQGWRHMDAAMKGLLVTQTGSIVITPITVKVGQWLREAALSASLSSTLSAGSKAAWTLESALSTIGTALEGGAADLGLSALGLVVIGLQWDEFRKSGQGTDSFAFRNLVANTTIMTFFTATSLVSAGIQVGAAFAGGAEAIAGTALGMAAGVAGAAALPLALLMIAVNGAVGSFMWLEEYGDYIRPSTDLGDLIGAGIAKFFGIETDVMKRAEVEKSAVGAASARERTLDQDRRAYMAFRGEQLAKSGYGSIRYPHLDHAVGHATFRVPKQDPDYTFVLQDREIPFKDRVLAGYLAGQTDRWDSPTPEGAGARSGTAWLDLRHHVGYGRSATADHGPQMFELQGAWGQFNGGADRDVFLLDGHSHADVHGNGGHDEVDLDARDRLVRIRHNDRLGGLRLATDDPDQPADHFMDDVLLGIESVTIRDALRAEVSGGPGDERFDVTALQTAITGGGGRNTYVLREGNRIASASDDAALWSGGVNAFIDVGGNRPGSLLLKVDVPHEDLSFRRYHGHRLVIRNGTGDGAGSLTLEGFFPRVAAGATASAPGTAAAPASLFIVDALGTHLTLVDPRRLDERESASATLDKHLFFDASTPDARRALTGDHGHTRHHLASGSGDFLLRPRTSMPMDVTLDVPLDRLSYRREGDDLVLIETPSAQAPADVTPLRLTLPGYARRDWAASHGQLALWARGTADPENRAVVKLSHPSPQDPDEGVLRAAAPDVAPGAASTTAASAPVPSTPTPTSTSTSTPPRVAGTEALTGSDGVDTYEVATQRHVVIDNTAMTTTRDILQLDAMPRRLWRSGADLVIETEGGSITVRRHAVEPLARHLSMAIDGRRYALPVIHDSGVMVYGPDADDGDILATLPGTHLVLGAPDAAWATAPAARSVVVASPSAVHRIGRSIDLRSTETRSRVILKDFPSWAREGSGLQLRLPDGSAPQLAPALLDAAWRDAVERQQRAGLPDDLFLARAFADDGLWDAALMTAVAALRRDLVTDSTPSERVHPVEAVQALLRMSGLPVDIADAVRATTIGQVRRIRSLLAALGDGKTWPSAALLDDYATSTSVLALSASRHGAMLRRLVAAQRPWAYQEVVLGGDLSPQALDAFETWATTRPAGMPDDDALLDDLKEFNRLLLGRPDADEVISADTRELLRIALRVKGRPDEVADQMARAMIAVTMDEAWIDGMLQAGVVDHAVLRALWDAKIPVRDVLLANANRLAYEGTGNRSGLIEVRTADAFRTPETTVSRYVVNRYLKLDDNGNDFIVHERPRRGSPTTCCPARCSTRRGNRPPRSPRGAGALRAVREEGLRPGLGQGRRPDAPVALGLRAHLQPPDAQACLPARGALAGDPFRRLCQTLVAVRDAGEGPGHRDAGDAAGPRQRRTQQPRQPGGRRRPGGRSDGLAAARGPPAGVVVRGRERGASRPRIRLQGPRRLVRMASCPPARGSGRRRRPRHGTLDAAGAEPARRLGACRRRHSVPSLPDRGHPGGPPGRHLVHRGELHDGRGRRQPAGRATPVGRLRPAGRAGPAGAGPADRQGGGPGDRAAPARRPVAAGRGRAAGAGQTGPCLRAHPAGHGLDRPPGLRRLEQRPDPRARARPLPVRCEAVADGEPARGRRRAAVDAGRRGSGTPVRSGPPSGDLRSRCAPRGDPSGQRPGPPGAHRRRGRHASRS
ncbi:C80 family cysteine peptidase [Roseateles sp. UC29_93]|uniref:C80 family cysteine peptidase n=1 Tax=Roseateles sp. UC29_93 TaxID=3350177 RepID=UPI003671BD9F